LSPEREVHRRDLQLRAARAVAAIVESWKGPGRRGTSS